MDGPHWEQEDFVLLAISNAIPLNQSNLRIIAEVLDASVGTSFLHHTTLVHIA
jgi:hypothetical protein